jgi:hypothetical protein
LFIDDRRLRKCLHVLPTEAFLLSTREKKDLFSLTLHVTCVTLLSNVTFSKKEDNAMKTILKTIQSLFERMEERLAASALAEFGVTDSLDLVVKKTPMHTFAETVEETLVEVAFAEAADYEDIHKALAAEKREAERLIKPDDCQYGDNDLCYADA